MNLFIENSWREALNAEFEKKYFLDLMNFIRSEYQEKTVFPPENSIFNAFNLCSFDNTKVVILGQDPYHDIGQAHGLSFSVNDNIAFPPSLRNIFKELECDLGIKIPETGNLTRWANQGVLLLNSTLTVRAHSAGSHQNRGWEQFTDAAIYSLAQQKERLVFLLWGAAAQKKETLVDGSRHLVLKSAHPSPLSAYRGFLGNRHFSLTNCYLKENGIVEIEW